MQDDPSNDNRFALGVCLGIALGSSLGLLFFGNPVLGIGIGVSLGLLGAAILAPGDRNKAKKGGCEAESAEVPDAAEHSAESRKEEL